MTITMRVTFFDQKDEKVVTSPVKMLVDGMPYTVTFERDRTVLVPGPIGLALVMSGLARDHGPVNGLDEWPRVTPAWH